MSNHYLRGTDQYQVPRARRETGIVPGELLLNVLCLGEVVRRRGGGVYIWVLPSV